MKPEDDQIEPDDPEERIPGESSAQGTDGLSERYLTSPARWVVLAVPLLTITFGGSNEPWVLGLFAIMVGGAYLWFPPKFRLSGSILLPLLFILALAFLAFFPVSAASLPEWRVTLSEQLGVQIPQLRSPQPWVTLEAWLMMAVSIMWMLYCLTCGYHAADRRFHLRSLALATSMLALAAIWVRRSDIVIPFWRGDLAQSHHFGPFPRISHFAVLLAVGGLLGFATTYDAFRSRKAFWVPLAASVVPIFAALMVNPARAGVILFFVGLGVWMLVAGFRKSSAKRMAIFLSVLLVLTTCFILMGQPLMDRLSSDSSISELFISDAHLYLLSDSLNLFTSQPIFGVGLGNFEPFFAFSQIYTDHKTRSLDPESDWLWFLAECGTIAFLLAIAVLILIVRKMGPFQSSSNKGRRERRLRNAAAVGVFVIFLQTFIDTPMHTLGLWTMGCLLAGLALHPKKLKHARRGAARWLQVGCAAFSITAGFLWLLSAAGIIQVMGVSGARKLELGSRKLAASGDTADAVKLLTKAIALKPLQWNFYFDRAALTLEQGSQPQQALEDFTRARELETHSGILCFKECALWLKHQPIYSLPALREAMLRDRGHAYGAKGFYEVALTQMRDFRELRTPLLHLATEPKLKLAYLNHALDDDDFNAALAALLDQAPNLETLSSAERRQLFRLWYDRGDKADLIAKLEKDADWRTDGWQVMAENAASKGEFKTAYQIASDNIPVPNETEATRDGNIPQLRREFLFNPTDVGRGLRLYGAQRAKGLIDDAVITLEKVARLPDPPASIIYEQAVMYSRKEDYVRAWERMKTYLSGLPKDI